MNNQIKILYFGHLVEMLYRDNEVYFLPMSVKDVRGLMTHLARRGENWGPLFTQHADKLKITVNKEFAGPDTLIQGGDEVAFVAFHMN